VNNLQIVLIGAGGHAESCIDVIEKQGQFQIVGLTDLPARVGAEILGYRVLGSDEDLPRLAREHRHALICVGQIKSPDLRMSLFARAKELGFALPTIVSPAASVSRHAVIRAGTIVMHGAIINAGARIGENCIINSRALLEHGVIVGDHCHVATGAIINGNARLATGSFIGSGSVIKEGITLGERCIVGMGACVRHSLQDRARFTG